MAPRRDIANAKARLNEGGVRPDNLFEEKQVASCTFGNFMHALRNFFILAHSAIYSSRPAQNLREW